METAKGKLSDLIDKLKENPALSEEEIDELAGGSVPVSEPSNGSCPVTNYVC